MGVYSTGSKGNIALPVSLQEVPMLVDHLRVSCGCASVGAGLEGSKTVLGSIWMMMWLVWLLLQHGSLCEGISGLERDSTAIKG